MGALYTDSISRFKYELTNTVIWVTTLLGTICDLHNNNTMWPFLVQIVEWLDFFQ